MMASDMAHGFRIVENAKLDARNTFGVAARAPMLVEVSDAAALPELFGYGMKTLFQISMKRSPSSSGDPGGPPAMCAPWS